VQNAHPEELQYLMAAVSGSLFRRICLHPSFIFAIAIGMLHSDLLKRVDEATRAALVPVLKSNVIGFGPHRFLSPNPSLSPSRNVWLLGSCPPTFISILPFLLFSLKISSASSRASLAASGLTSPSNGQRLGSFLASEKYNPRSYTLGLLVKGLSDLPQGLQIARTRGENIYAGCEIDEA